MNRKVVLTAVMAAALSFTGCLFAQDPPTIVIHAKRFAFVPDQITLTDGKPVKLEVISDDVAHSLRIDALNVNVKVAAKGTGETIVTPEQTGDFKGKCGIFCGRGHGLMVFTVHVVDGK